MKPKTKIEKQAMALSDKLPNITAAQKKYAFEHCFKHEAIIRKKDSNVYFCLECGHTWTADDTNRHDTVECPHCHRQLHVTVSRRQMAKSDLQSFQVITTAGDFQVTRTYYVEQITIPGAAATYNINEVHRIFQQPGSSDVVIARPRTPMPHICDKFCYNKPMSIQHEGQYPIYHICATVIYPRRRLLPILLRNGYCKEMYDFHPTYTFEKLWDKPSYETLAKTKRFDIWQGLEPYDVYRYWPQIKMCIRHNYHPSDFSMWKDTLHFAAELELDTNSPKYALPADLKGMHDQLMKRLQNKRRKEEELKKLEEVNGKRAKEPTYRKKMGKLLAVCIMSKDLTIRPLQNYDEYAAEGEAMHHCVETYWGKYKSLILTVRNDDKRIATVELNTKNFNVVQCRAACNAKPERYDEILSLINAHRMDFIRAAKTNM